jgi:hypothetical protein
MSADLSLTDTVWRAILMLVEVGEEFDVSDFSGLVKELDAFEDDRINKIVHSLADPTAHTTLGPPLEHVGRARYRLVSQTKVCRAGGAKTRTPRRPVSPCCYAEITTAGTCPICEGDCP